MRGDLSKYQSLAASGASARSVFLASRSDRLNLIESIIILRKIFGLSLIEAKEVAVTADGVYTSIEDFQASLVPAIERATYIIEQENLGRVFTDVLWRDSVVGYVLLEPHSPESLTYVGEWFPLNTDHAAEFIGAISASSLAEAYLSELEVHCVINIVPSPRGVITLRVKQQ
ncbi:MAG: hypothetical protein KF716_22625 [Anaerolineae bacterium]|nr:hypothetical protein [Anaerolineae bacterium]